MKKLTIILITFFALFLVSCNDDDDNPTASSASDTPTTTPTTPTTTPSASGDCNWKLDFFESGKKETTTLKGSCSTVDNVLTYKSDNITIIIDQDNQKITLMDDDAEKEEDKKTEVNLSAVVSNDEKTWEFRIQIDKDTYSVHTIQYL